MWYLPLCFSFLRLLWLFSLLWFHINFMFFFCVCEKCHWNFNKDYIESVDHFGEHGCFIDINFSNPFVSCSVFFISVLQFSVYKTFTSLVTFIPKYFIVFNVTVNGTAFLMSLSDSLSLAYQNASDFCMLILYPATLLNLFISSNSFFGRVFRVFYM